MDAIDADLDTFLAERSFLYEGGTPVITPTLKSKQTEMEVAKTAKALKKAVDDSIPPVPEPKQLDFHT